MRSLVLRRGCGGSRANLTGCDPDGERNTNSSGGNHARRGGFCPGRIFRVHAATINASDPNANAANRAGGGGGGGGRWNRCRGRRLGGGVAGSGRTAVVDTDDGSDFVFSNDALFVGALCGVSARAIVITVNNIIIVITAWREACGCPRCTSGDEARGG